MKYKIEMGDVFLCKKSFKMEDDNKIEYKRGGIYTSENNHCITDLSGDRHHEMGCLKPSEFFEYFKLI